MEYLNPVIIGSKTYEMENETDYLFTPELRIDGPFVRIWTKRPNMRAAYWLVRNGFRIPTKDRIYYSDQDIDSMSLIEPLTLLGTPTMISWGGYYMLVTDRIRVFSNDREFALAQLIHF